MFDVFGKVHGSRTEGVRKVLEGCGSSWKVLEGYPPPALDPQLSRLARFGRVTAVIVHGRRETVYKTIVYKKIWNHWLLFYLDRGRRIEFWQGIRGFIMGRCCG